MKRTIIGVLILIALIGIALAIIKYTGHGCRNCSPSGLDAVGMETR